MRAWRLNFGFLRKPQVNQESFATQSTVIISPSAKGHERSEGGRVYSAGSSQPFADTYDAGLFYLSSLHQDAITALIDAVECNRGLSALIAGPGSGKTALLYRLLECYSTAAHTAYLPLAYGSGSGLKNALLNELQRMLKNGGGADRRVLIILDEAHKLTSSELEVVCKLSRVKSRTSRLLHFMLAGRPELATMLSRSPLVDVKRRITVVNSDLHFSKVETARYINHRMKVAGHIGPPLFNREAINEIAAASRGVPRQINAICAKAISRMPELDAKEINGSMIRDIIRDPSFRSLSLASRQTDGAVAARGSQEKQPQPRPFIIANSTAQTRGLLQGIPLLRPIRGAYQAGVAAALVGVAVGVICLVALCVWMLGVTPHSSAGVAVRKQIDKHQPGEQTVVAPSVAGATSGVSNAETRKPEYLPVRTQMRDTTSLLRDEQVVPQTAITTDREEATDKLADLQPAPDPVDSGEQDSEAPPQLAATATSDLQMPPLNVPHVSARGPNFVSVATGGLLTTSEATSPQVVKMVKPSYPSKAKKQKIYGEVVVTGVVGADGRLKKITTSGPAPLEEAALKAAQEWRYKPPTMNGSPVEATARIVFNFSQTD